MITDDFWAYVVDAVEHLEQRSYYQLIGVPDDADSDTISHAYYALVRRLHPDRHIKESDGRQRMLTRVYARMNEAYQVLSKADARQTYDRLLARGQMRLTRADQAAEGQRKQGPDPRTAKARAIYDKGVLLRQRGDLRGARAQWQLAVQFEPDSRALADALKELEQAERAQAERDATTDTEQPGAVRAPAAAERIPPSPASAPASRPTDPAAFGRQALARGQWEQACAHLERALAARPRDRTLRALWYAALAGQAHAAGNARAATLHRQTALAFDAHCQAARKGSKS